ncbi:Acg family FMN-binding oxidoreductase [Mycolicibacterium psychrotolerans]|uniref:NAD(P)H nitroreductase n=1 Tax=Mycolicibacterium psychrotolerans TaxID=216929 RepID=A0A7I7MER9_9MYCO|nr:NAD(P)H nitroreductase [Mycolicibacterium psychrotolerans]BBX70688.1 NAD(P)H nitroreductase [Mycolicibacterium psychrotolerans]
MPTTQIRSELIVDALQVACRAPSLHNTQPWRWVLTDHTVELFADPSRHAPSADSSGRQAVISCGAALHHFRVAMAAAGWHTTVRRFPDPEDPLHLATVEFSPSPSASEDQRRLADAIMARRTDRLPLSEPPDVENLLSRLTADHHDDAVSFHLVAEELRSALAEASYLTDTARLFDSGYHNELYWWTEQLSSDDGIPPSALISAPESDRVDVGRTFPVSTQPERRSEIGEDRSRILVISTVDDSPESVLRCGEALSSALLEATIAGYATCTLTHITELPSGREVVAALIDGEAIPQALIRVGMAPALEGAPPPTPRRHIREVIEIRRE